MNLRIISNYINKLTLEDMINFRNRQKLDISDTDVNIIYRYVKKYYRSFLEGNHDKILSMIKKEVAPSTYEYIMNYYYKYKDKLYI